MVFQFALLLNAFLSAHRDSSCAVALLMSLSVSVDGTAMVVRNLT